MHRVKKEGGSVLVFVTIMIVVLLIMIGLGLDTGQLTYVRNQRQAAVDAGGFSGRVGIANKERFAGCRPSRRVQFDQRLCGKPYQQDWKRQY